MLLTSTLQSTVLPFCPTTVWFVTQPKPRNDPAVPFRRLSKRLADILHFFFFYVPRFSSLIFLSLPHTFDGL